MWLFYAMPDGYIPAGSDGQVKVPPTVRSPRQLKNFVASWLGKRAGRVYLMDDWTQKMCELGPTAFQEYIMRNGKCVAHS